MAAKKKKEKKKGVGGRWSTGMIVSYSFAGFGVAWLVGRAFNMARLRAQSRKSAYESRRFTIQAENFLIDRISPPKLADVEVNRALAWCTRIWDRATSKLAEAVIERFERDNNDCNAATTVANLMVRATEQHMRESNWSANFAVAAPDLALTERYGDTLRSAAALLNAAAGSCDHYGAHYSLALLLKLYPTLIVAESEPSVTAQAAAAHLCASQRASVRDLRSPERAGGPSAARAADACGSVQLVDDWTRAENVKILDVSAADARTRALSAKIGDVWRAADSDLSSSLWVGAIKSSGDGGSMYVQGLDSIVHDLPLDLEDDVDAQQAVCSIYVGSSGCYPAIWRQFKGIGDGSGAVSVQRVAVVDGYSGSSYYHWILECVPRILMVSEALRKHGEPPITLFVPNGKAFVEETLRLLPQEVFDSFTLVRRRDPSVKIKADVVYVPLWSPITTAEEKPFSYSRATELEQILARGGGSALCPPRAVLLRMRAALLGPLGDMPAQTKLVLISRQPTESRSFGNEAAIRDALAHVARQFRLEFEIFDGDASMSTTLSVFRAAALVVGVHGAGLSNVVFCSRGAAVLELRLPEPEFVEFRHIAQSLDLRYAASYLPPSNFEARAWPRPSVVATAAEKLLSGAKADALY